MRCRATGDGEGGGVVDVGRRLAGREPGGEGGGHHSAAAAAAAAAPPKGDEFDWICLFDQ